MITSTVKSLHVLDPVDGGILAFTIQFLVQLVFLGIPLFLFLARSGRIHAPIRVNERHTRRLVHVIFGMDFLWSHDLWHDGPAAAAQSVRGADDSSPDSGNGCGPNFWLGTANRPVGCTLGTLPTVLMWGVVWVDGVVSASSWWLAVHVSAATICPCFLRTTHVSIVWPSQDFCWAFSITTDDGSRRWTISRVPSTNHRSRSRPRGICTHGGDHPHSSSCRSNPSPDSHLSLFHQSQLMRDHVVRSIKVGTPRGKFKLLPPSWRTTGILSVMRTRMLC